MAMKNEVNMGLMVTISIGSALLLLVVVVGVQAWFMYEEHNELMAKWEYSPNVALEQMRSEQRAHLADYRVIDQNKKQYAMPIQEAMKIVAGKKGNVTFGPPVTK